MTTVVVSLSTIQSFHHRKPLYELVRHDLVCEVTLVVSLPSIPYASTYRDHSFFQEKLHLMRNRDETDWSVIPGILLFILLLITYYYVRIHFRFTSFMRELFFFLHYLFRNLHVICIIRK